jgi:hypothetical protein
MRLVSGFLLAGAVAQQELKYDLSKSATKRNQLYPDVPA